MDSSKVTCHRRKKPAKSVAEVKKRPVMKTELWPHTIANESDDEDITHDTIKLAKFLSCSTQIIAECESETEAAGRSVLLNAITSILEFQPWPEVRSFHNTVMTRIEQERIDWKSDFKLLAEQFVDKKVRLMLKSKALSTGTDRPNRGNPNNRNFGRGTSGFSGRGQGSQAGSNRPITLHCKQWNFGNCTYGSNCEMWHTCWTCYNNGKIGKAHKALSCPRGRNRLGQGDPRQGQGGSRS